MSTITITLPISGKEATIRRAKGKDMVDADILVEQHGGGPFTAQIALLSRIVQIDGKTLPFQDFLELDAADIELLGKQEPNPKPAESPPKPSSELARSQAGAGETPEQ